MTTKITTLLGAPPSPKRQRMERSSRSVWQRWGVFVGCFSWVTASGKLTVCYGKSPFCIGKSSDEIVDFSVYWVIMGI